MWNWDANAIIIRTGDYKTLLKHYAKRASRSFQPGEGPSASRGLLRDCENRLWNRWIVCSTTHNDTQASPRSMLADVFMSDCEWLALNWRKWRRWHYNADLLGITIVPHSTRFKVHFKPRQSFFRFKSPVWPCVICLLVLEKVPSEGS